MRVGIVGPRAIASRNARTASSLRPVCHSTTPSVNGASGSFASSARCAPQFRFRRREVVLLLQRQPEVVAQLRAAGLPREPLRQRFDGRVEIAALHQRGAEIQPRRDRSTAPSRRAIETWRSPRRRPPAASGQTEAVLRVDRRRIDLDARRQMLDRAVEVAELLQRDAELQPRRRQAGRRRTASRSSTTASPGRRAASASARGSSVLRHDPAAGVPPRAAPSARLRDPSSTIVSRRDGTARRRDPVPAPPRARRPLARPAYGRGARARTPADRERQPMRAAAGPRSRTRSAPSSDRSHAPPRRPGADTRRPMTGCRRGWFQRPCALPPVCLRRAARELRLWPGGWKATPWPQAPAPERARRARLGSRQQGSIGGSIDPTPA